MKDHLGVGREVKIQLAEPIAEELQGDISAEFGGRTDGKKNLIVSEEGAEVKNLVHHLVDQSIDVERVEEESTTLEDIYTSIIKEDEPDETD